VGSKAAVFEVKEGPPLGLGVRVQMAMVSISCP